MFYSCILDYGLRSQIYHKNLIDTYINYPYIFIPKKVIKLSEVELKEIIINNIHPRYSNIATKKWINLSNELIKQKNILDYLTKIKTFEELNNYIKSIKGFGQKTGGLLIRLIYDSGICKFEENIKSIPIDRHDIEISYLNNIINLKKLSNKNIEELSDEYIKVTNE